MGNENGNGQCSKILGSRKNENPKAPIFLVNWGLMPKAMIAVVEDL